MPNQCVAANCTNKRADGFSLFQMPSDENLRAKWIQQIRRTRSGPNGKLWNPTKNSFLCCAHFTEDCFNPVSKLKQQFGIEMKQHKKFLLPGLFQVSFPVPEAQSQRRARRSLKSAGNLVQLRKGAELSCKPGCGLTYD
ncbi:hypothetical protein Bbelb_373220 [Branchiostoma belcheri]|nr:hypothetical protein Bbelb_373220 [Branchiostoma belcheri]